jgi:predicted nucleic acid-binding protein
MRDDNKPLSAFCVLDASVGIKTVIQEDYSEMVRDYLGRLLDEQPVKIAVPDLFFIECANILWKNVRRGTYPADRTKQNITALKKFRLAVTPVTDLAAEAAEFACTYEVTAYDACYVVLADRLGVPLLTADNKLAGIARRHPLSHPAAGLRGKPLITPEPSS